MKKHLPLLMTIAIVVTIGCIKVRPTRIDDGKPATQAKESPMLALPSKSVDMTVVQREEQTIPGSDGSIRIQLGDITKGQVPLSVVTNDQKYLLEKVSVRQGDTVEFVTGKKTFTVHVKELRNNLIGDDLAKLTIAEAPEKSPADAGHSPDQLTEKQKIEALIQHVEQLKGPKFVRNGTEYDAATAAKFLRGKWEANAAEIKTARDFIEKAASVSSTSGQPYSIRFPDGKEMKSGEYLRAELAKQEKSSK